jgi:hypothetical protein
MLRNIRADLANPFYLFVASVIHDAEPGRIEGDVTWDNQSTQGMDGTCE